MTTPKETMKSTPVLPVHSTLTPDETKGDLVGALQSLYELDGAFRENGAILLNVPHLLPAPKSLTFLDKRRFKYYSSAQKIQAIPANDEKQENIQGLVGIHNASKDLPKEYRNPEFEPTKILTAEEMEAQFEELINSEKAYQTLAYFNIDLMGHAVRGEDAFELPCGAPLDGMSYIAGITTPYGYYSLEKSHFGAHVEDWNLASYNVLFAGATKLWIAVKPSSSELLETKIRELFPEAGRCSQFVRHLAISLTSSRLREWGIEHFFVPQKPGQLVAVTGKTYHWGINTGHNYAEAINFCMEKDWVAPGHYKQCYPGCGVAGPPMNAPVPEEGTVEGKMLSSNERAEAASLEWEKKKRDMGLAKRKSDRVKKLTTSPALDKDRMQKTPARSVRSQSLQPRTKPNIMAPPAHPFRTPASQQRSSSIPRPEVHVFRAAIPNPPSSVRQITATDEHKTPNINGNETKNSITMSHRRQKPSSSMHTSPNVNGHEVLGTISVAPRRVESISSTTRSTTPPMSHSSFGNMSGRIASNNTPLFGDMSVGRANISAVSLERPQLTPTTTLSSGFGSTSAQTFLDNKQAGSNLLRLQDSMLLVRAEMITVRQSMIDSINSSFKQLRDEMSESIRRQEESQARIEFIQRQQLESQLKQQDLQSQQLESMLRQEALMRQSVEQSKIAFEQAERRLVPQTTIQPASLQIPFSLSQEDRQKLAFQRMEQQRRSNAVGSAVQNAPINQEVDVARPMDPAPHGTAPRNGLSGNGDLGAIATSNTSQYSMPQTYGNFGREGFTPARDLPGLPHPNVSTCAPYYHYRNTTSGVSVGPRAAGGSCSSTTSPADGLQTTLNRGHPSSSASSEEDSLNQDGAHDYLFLLARGQQLPGQDMMVFEEPFSSSDATIIESEEVDLVQPRVNEQVTGAAEMQTELHGGTDTPPAALPEKNGSMKQVLVDYDYQCGVPMAKGRLCGRNLECRSHSKEAKRAVLGRSVPFDILLQQYRKEKNHQNTIPSPISAKNSDVKEATQQKPKRKYNKKRKTDDMDGTYGSSRSWSKFNTSSPRLYSVNELSGETDGATTSKDATNTGDESGNKRVRTDKSAVRKVPSKAVGKLELRGLQWLMEDGRSNSIGESTRSSRRASLVP